jgi:hypothetical protein
MCQFYILTLFAMGLAIVLQVPYCNLWLSVLKSSPTISVVLSILAILLLPVCASFGRFYTGDITGMQTV